MTGADRGREARDFALSDSSGAGCPAVGGAMTIGISDNTTRSTLQGCWMSAVQGGAANASATSRLRRGCRSWRCSRTDESIPTTLSATTVRLDVVPVGLRALLTPPRPHRRLLVPAVQAVPGSRWREHPSRAPAPRTEISRKPFSQIPTGMGTTRLPPLPSPVRHIAPLACRDPGSLSGRAQHFVCR